MGISNAAASIKRIAYIARRASFLQEINDVVIKVVSVPGTANPADIFTKFMKIKEEWYKYCARVYNVAIALFRK